MAEMPARQTRVRKMLQYDRRWHAPVRAANEPTNAASTREMGEGLIAEERSKCRKAGFVSMCWKQPAKPAAMNASDGYRDRIMKRLRPCTSAEQPGLEGGANRSEHCVRRGASKGQCNT